MIKNIFDLVSEELYSYVQSNVLKYYDSLDVAHDKEHILNVIIRSITMGNVYGLDSNILLVCAAYHDVGLLINREDHEKNSALFFRKDEFMRNWFSNKEIELIAEAIEDHRAVSEARPRSIYGEVLHDVDTFGGDLSELIRRSIGYGKRYFTKYSKSQHFERIFKYLNQKYGECGYACLYIKYAPHQKNWDEIKIKMNLRDEVQVLFDTYYIE